ncbi:MAG: hypothetical protein U0R69_08365 [Gaiellales bacterium]
MSGTHVEVTRTGAGHLTRFAAVDTLVLRDGAQVVLRVLAAPQGGGQGLVALAGRRLAAELPAGLVPGQRLTVTVEGQDGGRVLLRILGERGAGATTDTRSCRTARAVSGDAEPPARRARTRRQRAATLTAGRPVLEYRPGRRGGGRA